MQKKYHIVERVAEFIESGITRYTSIASSFLTNMKYCERTRMKDYSSET